LERERLPSLLLYHEDRITKSINLGGNLRSLAWDPSGAFLFVVGDRGRILKITRDAQERIDIVTQQNLRAVAVNAAAEKVLVVGNAGTMLLLDGTGRSEKLNSPTTENLRSAAWNPSGTLALVAGNRGGLLKYDGKSVQSVDDGTANLRHVAWHPSSENALVTSNCFAEEFIPSPTLFQYDLKTGLLKALNEGRADLIGADWKPNGEAALVVGYDVVWHNGYIGSFDGRSLTPLEFENKRVYPVAVAWNLEGTVAAIVTATTEPGIGRGSVYLWDANSVKEIFASPDYFFSAVAWSPDGRELVALASKATRTFSC
jgi:WD40 repeat protein